MINIENKAKFHPEILTLVQICKDDPKIVSDLALTNQQRKFYLFMKNSAKTEFSISDFAVKFDLNHGGLSGTLKRIIDKQIYITRVWQNGEYYYHVL